MTDYPKVTGNAGTLIIRDTGGVVSLIVKCTDGVTNVGSITFATTINGVQKNVTVSLPAGFGEKVVRSEAVSTSQTVVFNMPASGTSGLGGPTNHSANINRAPVATPPGPVAAPTITDRTSTTVTFTWPAPATGGSAITDYQWVVELPSGTDVVSGYTGSGSTRAATATDLTPGSDYTVRVRAYNALGTTSWTSNPNTRAFTTPQRVNVSDGAAWQPGDLWESDGSVWRPGLIDASDGAAWNPVV